MLSIDFRFIQKQICVLNFSNINPTIMKIIKLPFILASIIFLFSCKKELKNSQVSELEKLAYQTIKARMGANDFETLDWNNIRVESINNIPTLLKIKSKVAFNKTFLFACYNNKLFYNWIELNITDKQENVLTGILTLKDIDNSLMNQFCIVKNRIQQKKATNQEDLSIILNNTPETQYTELPEVTVIAYYNFTNFNYTESLTWWSLYWLFNMNNYWYNQYTADISLIQINRKGDGSLDANDELYNLYNPLFSFPKNSNYETLYPRFTQLIKSELKMYVMSNPNILAALKKFTGLTEAEIKTHLTWGKGPTLKIEDIPTTYYGDKPIGQFRPADPNSIIINKSDVAAFESYQGFTREAMWFLLAVSVLHEYVHYGDYKFDGIQAQTEVGFAFEYELYGRYIYNIDDAKKYIEIYYKRK